MSGEIGNKDFAYLTYFGLNPKSSLNDKLMVFSSAVIKTYRDIRNALKKDPNYVYEDEEMVRNLTSLRSDILTTNSELIKDYIWIRYDYICVKFRKKVKDTDNIFSFMENEVMVEDALSYRNDTEYYMPKNENGTSDIITFYERKLRDMEPYFLPQDRNLAFQTFAFVASTSIVRVTNALQLLWHNEPCEKVVNSIKERDVTTGNKNLDFYGKHIFYHAGGCMSLFPEYIRNGTGYVKAYMEDIGKEYYTDSDYEHMNHLLDPRLAEIDRDHSKKLAELLPIEKILYTPGDCNGLIVITDIDFYTTPQVIGTEAIESKTHEIYGLKEDSSSKNYQDLVEFYKDLGDVSIVITKTNGIVDIEANIPDEINKYQRSIINVVIQELMRVASRKKPKKTKSLHSSDLKPPVEINSVSFSNLEMAAKLIAIKIGEYFHLKRKQSH